MLARVRHCDRDLADAAGRAVRRRLANALRLATTSSLVLGTATDLLRGKPELVAENALLRRQLLGPGPLDQAAAPHPIRSRPAGSVGGPRPGVAPGAPDRPTRDAPPLAPSRLPALLALAVDAAVAPAASPSRASISSSGWCARTGCGAPSASAAGCMWARIAHGRDEAPTADCPRGLTREHVEPARRAAI